MRRIGFHIASSLLVAGTLTWAAGTPATAQGLASQVFFGSVHNHTGYSDGVGRPEDAFAAGRTPGNHFFFLTEHSEWLDVPVRGDEDCLGSQAPECLVAPPTGRTEWQDVEVQAQSASDPALPYLGLRGFEWSSPTLGHLNVLLSRNYTPTGPEAPTMDAFWRWLLLDADAGGGSDGLVTFNHPSRERHPVPSMQTYEDFRYVPEADSRVVGLEVFNRGDDYSACYVRALDRGWHVGALGAADAHENWGRLDRSRTALVLSQGESLTEAAVRRALVTRRFYATFDHDLQISFTADGRPMGSRLTRPFGRPVALQVEANEQGPGETIVRIELYGSAETPDQPCDRASGRIALQAQPVATAEVGASSGVLETAVVPPSGEESWYFAKVIEADGQVAYTSPVWIRASGTGRLLAGAARVDSTWHVGASAGQYASDGTSVGDHGVDPFTHQTRRAPSYGIQGREWVRALVVEGPDGRRWALLTNDLYIPQDLVNRRVAGILAEHDRQVALGQEPGPPTGITPENLTISVSHSHSSPYYSTPSWGVWAFQDVFDLRYFEHIARRMAAAVIVAARDLRPARVGAAAIPFTVDGTPLGASWLKKHSYGRALGDDGTPAGYPSTDTDRDLAVIRFDDFSDPAHPGPLATWVVWGNHPENLDGNDLLTGEYVNTMMRIVDRELGGVTLFSQNDTGTAEAADNLNAHPPHLRQEFSHKEYAQMERAARTLSDGVETAWRDVTTSDADLPPGHRVVPFRTDAEISVKDLRFAPPGYRAFPSVSSCRTENTFEGNPGFPIVGLPDCGYVFSQENEPADHLPFNPAVTYDMLRDLCDDGLTAACVPDNVGGPSYTGLQETLQVHLQAVRIGDIGITVCPCEQWADQSRNIKTRLDRTSGNLWYGWDWTANYTDPAWQPGVIYDGRDLPGHGPATLNDWCLPTGDGGWACRNPRNPGQRITISDLLFRRMKAQIYNDAAGWDRAENAFQAETEPADPAKVWGNFTHEELTEHAYALVVTVGMSNDYWGYIASYREFQRGDHYRKALTGLGPHSMDFLATRLSRMAAELNGGPEVTLGPKDLAYAWDYVHQGLRQDVLGRSARTFLPAYEAQIPADGGTPTILEQPQDIGRFDAARMAWIGGSNWSDIPHARVERCVAPVMTSCASGDPTAWAPYANGFGEVQVKANYPGPEDLPAWRAGAFTWVWEATFEAFDSDVALPDAGRTPRVQTPSGVYRFVIDGCRKGPEGSSGGLLPDPACGSYDPLGRVRPYHLVSGPFEVRPWDGITIQDIRLEPDRTVSFAIGPRYPHPSNASNMDEILGGLPSNPIDYPDTYTSPFRFIHGRQDAQREEDDDIREYGPGPEDDEVFCFHCSFAPWADTGAVERAVLTVVRPGRAGVVRVEAVYDPSTGRWRAPIALRPRDRAYVERGGVVDTFGEYNGQPSAVVVRPPG